MGNHQPRRIAWNEETVTTWEIVATVAVFLFALCAIAGVGV